MVKDGEDCAAVLASLATSIIEPPIFHKNSSIITLENNKSFFNFFE